MSGPLLRLGHADRGVGLTDPRMYLRAFHEGSMTTAKFRDEPDETWRALDVLDGAHVTALQSDLADFGFYPKDAIDGVFGYRTVSGARLFQGYVRTIEGHTDIGTPDGIVGGKTWEHLERWHGQGKRVEWADETGGTEDHKRWIRLLQKAKRNFTTEPTGVLQLTDAYPEFSDTRTVRQWNVDPSQLHLIGIRRKEWFGTDRRDNDDVFVLLVKGMTFLFAGSTDPSPNMAGRSDEAFLTQGQHTYRFGWHKLSDVRRVYRAFKPAVHGVLVFRDRDGSDSLTESDFAQGVEPNDTINIHWSGIGTSNWSAGCQVISGKTYINHLGQPIDCSAFASPGYRDLGRKTRGAYNVLVDILTVIAPSSTKREGAPVHYTLLYERDLDLEPEIGMARAAEISTVLTPT